MLLSLIMIFTKRYQKHYLKYGAFTHYIVGSGMTFWTLVRAFQALDRTYWRIPTEFNPHYYFGIAVLGLVMFMFLSGWLTVIIGQFTTPKPWQHHKELFVKIG